MGDFSADWLALREPADSRARSVRLTRRLVARLGDLPDAPGASSCPLRVLDLGCGTGANLRYLAPRLSLRFDDGPWGRQDWICVDRDLGLLADLTRRSADWARGLELRAAFQGEGLCIQGMQTPSLDWRIRTLALDLAKGAASLPMEPGTLVVASALLDLVSADWLAGLLRACAGAGSPLLLALTYDGRVALSPVHPRDGTLTALVNAHQRGDKGLGPALGPTAPAYLADLAAVLGFAMEVDDSDWDLGPDESGLQSALIEGWAVAAQEQAHASPDSVGVAEEIRRWQEARQAQIAAGRLRIRVGHQDALLFPLSRLPDAIDEGRSHPSDPSPRDSTAWQG
jgi:SAM-dependent methyltransferase